MYDCLCSTLIRGASVAALADQDGDDTSLQIRFGPHGLFSFLLFGYLLKNLAGLNPFQGHREPNLTGDTQQPSDPLSHASWFSFPFSFRTFSKQFVCHSLTHRTAMPQIALNPLRGMEMAAWAPHHWNLPNHLSRPAGDYLIG